MEDTNLMQISLHKLRFFGPYGLYPVEQKWTTEIQADIHLSFIPNAKTGFTLANTIDYQGVYDIANQVFAQNEELLENLANKLAIQLRIAFPQVVALKIEIFKKPILQGPIDSVSVSYHWSAGLDGN
ncbi:MAG: dihydroneopterin aldolase [Saprospiraceae bacterium]|nr:dihydroneopterin aldolase [Saprospiraceae bacterium]